MTKAESTAAIALAIEHITRLDLQIMPRTGVVTINIRTTLIEEDGFINRIPVGRERMVTDGINY